MEVERNAVIRGALNHLGNRDLVGSRPLHVHVPSSCRFRGPRMERNEVVAAWPELRPAIFSDSHQSVPKGFWTRDTILVLVPESARIGRIDRPREKLRSFSCASEIFIVITASVNYQDAGAVCSGDVLESNV